MGPTGKNYEREETWVLTKKENDCCLMDNWFYSKDIVI